MVAILTVLHILISFGLILVVLLQSGKGGGLAGVLGGGAAGSQTLFGGRGAADFLSKTTSVLATLFMVSSLSLALIAGRSVQARSVVRENLQEEGFMAPGAATPSELQLLEGEGAEGESEDAGAEPAPAPEGETPPGGE
jgi:preprotein translocase subunit SecG